MNCLTDSGKCGDDFTINYIITSIDISVLLFSQLY